ncbi:hypothetical protein [Psychrobacillus glaciei]|uniref:hypothetical protein n=1 Tax=Psychrobacillus glaciei TaxID=2283160 RepID=UPI001CEFAFB0|nr:hypothetical protein [Psychrobacillus glaciei]
MWNGDIVEIITIILAWFVIGMIAFRLYKKHSEKPKLWKVIIVILLGFFSFSFNWNVFDRMIQVAVLPLGVWILYGVLKRKKERWEKYRPFAWLGFFANFILLSFILVALPINFFIFPENKPETYISNVEKAFIINIHPSAKEHQQVKENLLKLIHRLKQEEFFSDEWYNETYMDTESNKRKERFPYMLINTLPKWGSGLSAIVYIEGDGKGLLIVTPKKQYYFHSDQSLLEEGK